MTYLKSLILAGLGLAGLGFLAGCDREAVAARNVTADRGQTVLWSAGPCDRLVVPSGFALGWKKYNHRLSRWGVGLDKDACDATRFEVTHVGGVFSKNPVIDDEPWVKFSYQQTDLDDDVAAARVSVQDVIGPAGVVTGAARFSLATLGLTDRNDYVAMIEGVRYDTGIEQTADYPSLYNPARGYTTRGLGVKVDAEVDGDDLVINYTVSFVAGRTPERVFMNRALPFARIGAGIDVIIVGTGQTPITRGSVSYEMEHDRPMPFMDPKLPAADEPLRTVAMRGAPGAPKGFWGLQSFQFALDFDDDCSSDEECSSGDCIEGKCGPPLERLGEYIREFAVGVEMKDYDPTTGQARFVVDGYTSNASSFLAFYPLRYQFDGGFAWVQAAGETRSGSLESDFATGSASFDLD